MKLIFDIGYNVGAFTKACFKKHPGVHVIAVEANPALCGAEQTDNFELLNFAVSDKLNEFVELHVDRRHNGISTVSDDFMMRSRFKLGSSRLKRHFAVWGDAVKVPTTTLDLLIALGGVPDLIKIDVEGYEHKVLLGLTKKAKDICFEWHEEMFEVAEVCIKHLMGLGYKEFGVVGFFDEGDVFEKATFSIKGAPHLEYPKKFYLWDDLEIEKLVKPGRRINYGMVYAR